MKRKVLYPLFLAAILVALDQTIVTTVLPEMATTLNSTANYSWIVSAYLLSSAVVMPVAGRLTDLHGGRSLLLLSVSLFTLGSLACGIAPTMTTLIVGRAIQGLGGGAILAVGTAVIGLNFEGAERASAFATLGVFTGIAAALGPTLGGIITDHLSWRWIFLLNIPLGAIALYGITVGLGVRDLESSDPMDWLGAFLCLTWSVPLLFVASWGGSKAEWNSPVILALLALVLIGLSLFCWIEFRATAPLFDLGLLSDPAFRNGGLAYFFMGATTTTAILFFPLYLVEVKLLTVTQAGVALTPQVLGLIAGNSVAARWSKKSGRLKPTLIAGNLVAVASLGGIYIALAQDASVQVCVLWLALLGIGFGLAVPIYPSAVQMSTPSDRMGTVSSALQFGRVLGAALGSALLGAVLASGLDHATVELSSQVALHRSLMMVYAGVFLVSTVTAFFTVLIPEGPKLHVEPEASK